LKFDTQHPKGKKQQINTSTDDTDGYRTTKYTVVITCLFS